MTVDWFGKPVFIARRAEEEIAAARNITPDAFGKLRDPALDKDRATNPEWLIVIGLCTFSRPRLRCVLKGQEPHEARGAFGGWFCPCHATHYDTAGRVRRGLGSRNLPIPRYGFLDDSTVRLMP